MLLTVVLDSFQMLLSLLALGSLIISGLGVGSLTSRCMMMPTTGCTFSSTLGVGWPVPSCPATATCGIRFRHVEVWLPLGVRVLLIIYAVLHLAFLT